jgi:hypothetical protein
MDRSRVTLTTDQLSAVASRIAAFELNCPPDRRWLRPYVRDHRIFPLVIGWVETVGIAADGRICKFSADGEQRDYEGRREIDDRVMLIHALLVASRVVPQLESLRPIRPQDAVTCAACDGRGGYASHPEVICSCGGVGWVPGDAS